MLLREMFSAIGAPKEEDDINWAEDLKFFIDNETDILSNELFPAIKKHKSLGNHPDAYKLYIKPIQKCKDLYVEKYEISEPQDKITKDNIITLAKQFAEEQNTHITDGDYED